MLNWIKRTMLTSTCAAYNGGKPQPISCNSATSKSPLNCSAPISRVETGCLNLLFRQQ